MAKYCLDTSGLSNPLMELPEDIHVSLWSQVKAKIEEGVFCWNGEIAIELKSIFGSLGECLENCSGVCCLEIGSGTWDWQSYLKKFEELRKKYKNYISEYNGNRKNTVGLNDVSIIALAIVLKLPVMSMEKPNRGSESDNKMRIPDVCAKENVTHKNFTDFLRAEGIKA